MIVKKMLLGLDQEALNVLNERVARAGNRSANEVVRDCIMADPSRVSYGPNAEAYIAWATTKTGKSRSQVIEDALLREMERTMLGGSKAPVVQGNPDGAAAITKEIRALREEIKKASDGSTSTTKKHHP